HLPIRASAGELGGQVPEIDTVFLVEGVGAETVLRVMMQSAEADAEDVMRNLPGPGVGGRAQMRKVDAGSLAFRDAAAMRPDPAPVPRPDLLDRHAARHLRPL